MSLRCLLLVFIHIFETSGFNFISFYGGQSVTGVVGSSFHFKWRFTAGLRRIQWGLKKDGQNTFETNGILITINALGNVQLTSQSEYATRVNGTIDVSSGRATFILANLKRADERFYGARIVPISSGSVLSIFDSVQLVMKEAPSIIHPVVLSEDHNEGINPVNIICEANGRPDPDVRWIHNGKVKSSGTKTTLLTFTPIAKEDAGLYTCTANNSVGSAEKNLSLVVNYRPEGTAITLSENNVVQGDNVTLTCQVTAANPPVSEYRVYLNESSTPVYTLKSTNNITINNVQRSQHYGEYKCEAHNAVGNGQSSAVVLAINVPVTIKPFTGNITVNETNPIDLRCEASGYPAPTITWNKDGRQIHSESVFRIERSSRIHSGVYICIANNTVGKAEMEIFVFVYYQASITSATPPTTKSWIKQIVSLKCVADGVPTPTITWKKPDGTEARKVTATENIADIEMKKDQDFGQYTCEAKNEAGPADTRTVQVQQIKAPGSPSITSRDEDIQATSINVKWTEPADGGSPITAYRVVVLHGRTGIRNENITDITSDEFKARAKVIERLSISTNYTVKVFSRNFVFEGEAGEKTIRTKFQGIPAAAEIIDLPAETKETKVTIKWNKAQNNGANVTQYNVYRRIVTDDGKEGEWEKVSENPPVRAVNVSFEKGKEYEVVVTATNTFGESLKEDDKIKKIMVLGDVPDPVVFEANVNDDKVTLKWKEPENNGAVITQYSIYQRVVNDEQWTKVEVINDVSKREFVVTMEKGKQYEFVVTARNKYGESLKNEERIKTVNIEADKAPQDESGAMNTPVIAGAAAAGVLLIIGLIILAVWWKRRKRSSDDGSSVAGLRNVNPDELDDGYHAVGAPSAARQLQACGRVPDATYAQVDMSQKTNRPVADVYAQVDKSKKTKKKQRKNPGELDYAELDDLRSNVRPAPPPSGANARPLVRAPAYEGTEYADITQFGAPQPEPTYGNVPKKDVVYSNVETMCSKS